VRFTPSVVASSRPRYLSERRPARQFHSIFRSKGQRHMQAPSHDRRAQLCYPTRTLRPAGRINSQTPNADGGRQLPSPATKGRWPNTAGSAARRWRPRLPCLESTTEASIGIMVDLSGPAPHGAIPPATSSSPQLGQQHVSPALVTRAGALHRARARRPGCSAGQTA